MTSDHQEVIERLQFIAAQANLSIRDIRKGNVYNTNMDLSNIQTQVTTALNKVNADYSKWCIPND